MFFLFHNKKYSVGNIFGVNICLSSVILICKIKTAGGIYFIKYFNLIFTDSNFYDADKNFFGLLKNRNSGADPTKKNELFRTEKSEGGTRKAS